MISRLRLFLKALFMFVIGTACISAMVFIPAGTFSYPGGILFSAALLVPIFIMMFILAIFAPDLLEKRLSKHETEKRQKLVVGLSALMFICGFVIAGLDYRFGWTQLPIWVMTGAAVIMLLSYIMLAEVMRENAYLSRTVEVQENQKVVDSGLYGIVRHPMYSGTVVMFLMMPLVLGSFAAFVIFLAYPILIAIRIQNEEKVLCEGLEGYNEYRSRVRYRLIPFIW